MTDARGIDRSYVDANGQEQHVPEATVEVLAGIIGEPTDHAAPVVVRAGETPDVGRGDVHLEDGGTRPVDGPLPGDLPLGYHLLVSPDGAERPVIVSPGRCHLPAGWRAWGWAAQLYAARSEASWGMGDLGDLSRLARWSRTQGAGFVLVNPLGAVAPVGAQQPSPYYPSSRRYRNPLYLRVEDVPGAEQVDDGVERAAAAGRALNADRAIDRDAVWALKEPALRAIWAGRHGEDGFDAWYRTAPEGVRQFATWTALAGRLGAGWQDWPADCRHPDGPGLAAAADDLGDEVRFHAWLQWLLEGQLAAAGRELPVVQDLPIGVDPGGFDAWAWQDLLALDVSVGAPGDEFNRQGQDWGLPPFVPWRLRAAGYRPFIETIRASMAAGGG
ncbi:MAG TPA: 4-alpha-glucanotransferase, partial [Aquihabitans sp.]|nr:4-alpha-glucanotransferase [Aquihabitans sp.]